MLYTLLQIFALAAFSVQHVASAPAPAQVTIVGPLAEQTQILTATVIGVDESQARTTYVVEEDQPFGTAVSASPVMATYVAGSDYIFGTFSQPPVSRVNFGTDCSLKDGNAICSGLNGNSQQVTQTISAAFLRTNTFEVVATATPTGPVQTKNSASRISVSTALLSLLAGGLVQFLL
ncbi:hypothetical protein C8R46DRAFT_1084374 [Mycena filopes]|nr:hypothetical protein C8R46DRAFT_1084374 [Mycena filopes]